MKRSGSLLDLPNGLRRKLIEYVGANGKKPLTLTTEARRCQKLMCSFEGERYEFRHLSYDHPGPWQLLSTTYVQGLVEAIPFMVNWIVEPGFYTGYSAEAYYGPVGRPGAVSYSFDRWPKFSVPLPLRLETWLRSVVLPTFGQLRQV